MVFFKAVKALKNHRHIKAWRNASVLIWGLVLCAIASGQVMTLQDALMKTNYAVSSCDINGDGQLDYLVKGGSKTIILPIDDDFDIPLVIPPKGPSFLIQSFAGINYLVVQSPEKALQDNACWTPTTYSAKPGDGKAAPAGTLFLSPAQGDGASFLIGIQSGTNNLQLAGIKRPAVVADPSSGSAPTGFIPVPSKTQTRTVAYEYESATGLLSKQVVEPDNVQMRVEVSLTYDDWGNIATSTVSSTASGSAAVVPRVTKNQYDDRGQFLRSTTNAEGHTDTLGYDQRHGVPTTVIDPNTAAVKAEYDSFGRLTRQIAADGTAVKFEYAYCSDTVVCPSRGKYRVTQTPVNAGSSANGPWSRHYFDELDRNILTESAGYDAGSVISSTQSYDDLGRVYQTTRPAFQGQGRAVSTYTYDILGRPLSVEGPDGAVSSIEYNGLQTISRDPLQNARTTIRDSQGRVAKVIDPVGASVTYEYDASGNLYQTTDSANNATRLAYDLNGNKIAMVGPDLGYWQYAYDALGQLIRQVDGKGQTSNFAYDRLGRMVSSNEPDMTVNRTYDSCAKGIGSLCKESTPSGFARTYAYDSLGRLISTNALIENVNYATSVGYDADGRVATLTYPSGFAIKYIYSALGDLAEVRNNASNALYWQSNQRDALGRLTSQRFGNGLVTDQEFEPLSGRIKNIFAGSAKGVQNLNYQFDLAGNLLSRKDTVQGMSESFAFDSGGRLTDAQLSSPAVSSHQAFAYDATGNVLSRSDLGVYSYGSSLHPHAVTSVAMADGGRRNYTYDAAGNVTRIQQVDSKGWEIPKSSLVLTYTSFNGVRTVVDGSGENSLGLAYGTNHERIMQQSAEGVRVYVHPDNAGSVLYEKLVQPNGVVEHDYFITAEGQTVAIVKEKANTLTPVYLHQDDLGSTAVVTDASGAVSERLSYDVFGKRRAANGTPDPGNAIQGTNTHRGYTFHEHADTFGLINMNGRFYDPAIGRFLAADPNVPYEDDPQSFNRYAYGRNSPLNNVDYSGFDDTEAPNRVDIRGRYPQEDGSAVRASGIFEWFFKVLIGYNTEGNISTVTVAGTKQFSKSDYDSRNYAKISAVMSNGLGAGRTLDSDESSANRRRIFWNNFKNGFGQGVSDASQSRGYPDVTDGTADRTSTGYLLGIGVGTAFVSNASFGGRMPAGLRSRPALFGECFVAGTLIWTPTGARNIEDVQIGDIVYALQPETKLAVPKPVVQLFRNVDKPIVRVSINDAVGNLEEIGATPDHPFWVEGKGWVAARMLQVGDELFALGYEGWKVASVIDNHERANTYNFEVKDLHNYLVGQHSVLVHNASKVNFRGGAHGDIKGLNGRESHHMPAHGASNLSKNKGPAIQMDIDDHRKTSSWGYSRKARAYRAAQAERIKAGDFAGAQRMDIQDIISRFGTKYDAAIKQMIEYTNKLGL